MSHMDLASLVARMNAEARPVTPSDFASVCDAVNRLYGELPSKPAEPGVSYVYRPRLLGE